MFVLPLVRKHPIWVTIAAVIAAVLVGWWLNPWHADAAGETESVYVGIEPTRCIDTRNNERVGPHGFFGANTTKTIQITGVTECGVPDGATAALFNLSGIGASETTFITAYPTGSEPSTTSVLNSSPASRVVGNAVTVTLSDDGAIDMFNSAGVMNITIDVLGYYTPAGAGGTGGGVSQADFDALQATVAQQANTIDELTALLAGVERAPDINGYDTITFTGVNLQLVDGTGTTYDTPSGLGNLIIGYNTPTGGDINNEIRDGAHNLVIGNQHTYGNNGAGDHAAGGIVAGNDNTIDAEAASVTGGEENTASGALSSVSGGVNNTATGAGSSITGGVNNETSVNATYASITGGTFNTVNGLISSITGGEGNEINANAATITGGAGNAVAPNAPYGVIVGGGGNTVTGDASVVVGGTNNFANGESAVAVGGLTNQANGNGSVTVGGAIGNAQDNLTVSIWNNGAGFSNCTVNGNGGACTSTGTLNTYS